MSRRGIALVGILAVPAVLIAAALWEAPRIEHDLTARSEQLLTDRGIAGVAVRFDGRDAVLAGPGVTDPVVALVAGQRGVRQVRVEDRQESVAVLRPELGYPSPSPVIERGSEVLPASRVARKIVEVLGPEGLRFDPGSTELTAAQGVALDRVAALLVPNPSIRLQVAGHTDAVQAGQLTKAELSRQRAAAVAGYLVARGVVAAAMAVEGYGDTRPVADNGTAAGRAANRRVEITVLGG